MHPKLLEIPFVNLPIYSYGFLVMMGFLTGIFILSRRASRDDISPEVIFDIGLVAMISGIVGARILHVIYFYYNFDFALFNLSDGGLNVIAGIVGFFIPFVIHYRRSKHEADVKKASQSSMFSFNVFIKLLILSFVVGVITARLVYLLLHKSEYNWGVLYIWQGGLVFYGGVFLAIISIIVYLRKKRLSVMKVGDLLMPGILLGLAFGRIGCFLNGCCYGKLSSSFWSVCFPAIKDVNGEITGSPVFVDQVNQHLITSDYIYSLPIHPTQIYESVLGLTLFIILSIIWANKRRFNEEGNPVETTHGFVVAYGGIFYSIGRFIIELFRGDNKDFFGNFSYSQLVSLGLFLVSLCLFIWLKLKNKRAE
jgi:phosphatidylglycerol---prolipoprotein diacylglyceryl transferase